MENKVINLFGNNIVDKNEGPKYSDLLDKFISNFQLDFPEDWFIDEVFDFSILAWNFGNMEVIMPSEEVGQMISKISNKAADIRLLKKMTEYKIDKFKEYTRFIVDFEINNVDIEPTLVVITESEEAFLAQMIHDRNNQPTLEDLEENYINRSAIILKPKQPFFDWINNLDSENDLTLEETQKANIYLIDNNIDDVKKWINKKFDKFFKMELEEWHENKKEWPQKRNFKMFNQWFQVDISTEIYDLEKRPIIKEY